MVRIDDDLVPFLFFLDSRGFVRLFGNEFLEPVFFNQNWGKQGNWC